MSDKSTIEWTDATWNPVTGCTKVSPGCAYCYAEAITLRFKRGGRYLPGEATIKTHPERLEMPLKWKAPRRIFVNSVSDLFHEEVPPEFIRDVFDIMSQASHHIFQVLTKRHQRLADISPDFRLALECVDRCICRESILGRATHSSPQDRPSQCSVSLGRTLAQGSGLIRAP